MEFQWSYLKSWKMLLWKCCTQYASKFGKLSSGHRTGKGQFSFQSQRKVMIQCMKMKSESEVAQSCPTLSDPMDCSSPGSSIHGIFQARALEWGAMAFSVPSPSGFQSVTRSLHHFTLISFSRTSGYNDNPAQWQCEFQALWVTRKLLGHQPGPCRVPSGQVGLGSSDTGLELN